MSVTKKTRLSAPLVLNDVLTVGYPTYPQKFYKKFRYEDIPNLTWYKQTANGGWRKCGEGFIYTPWPEDTGYKLKLECRKGSKTYIVISTTEVEDGPPGNNPCLQRCTLSQSIGKNRDFRVVTYNILAGTFTNAEYFPYCPTDALRIQYRKQLILQELFEYFADIFCLQEVDTSVFHDDLKPFLRELGFDGVFMTQGADKARDGQACFYNTNSFRFVHSYDDVIMVDLLRWDKSCADIWKLVRGNAALKKNVIKRRHGMKVVVLDSVQNPNERIILANTHLVSKEEYAHIKALQTLICMNFLQQVINEQKRRVPDKKISLIFCGDYNSIPTSAVYTFMTTGKVSARHSDFVGSPEKRAAGKILFKHQCNLESACGTPRFSNYNASFVGLLDYIFYDKSYLNVVGTVPIVSTADVKKNTAIPSVYFPSDHIPLIADFKFKSSGSKKK